MRVATIAYFMFYLAFSMVFIIGSAQLDVPIWQRLVGILTNLAVILCIVLYIQGRRPAAYRLLFKLVPLLMLAWMGMVVYIRAVSETPSTLGIVLFVLVLFPALYLSARFAYLPELKHKLTGF
jgi:hypothetical protein